MLKIERLCVGDFRIQAMDSCLEDVPEQSEDTLDSDVASRLSSSLELTRCELAACRDCCDEAENQLARLCGPSTAEVPNSKTGMHGLCVLSHFSVDVLTLYKC